MEAYLKSMMEDSGIDLLCLRISLHGAIQRKIDDVPVLVKKIMNENVKGNIKITLFNKGIKVLGIYMGIFAWFLHKIIQVLNTVSEVTKNQ